MEFFSETFHPLLLEMEVDHEHSSSQGDKLGEGNKPADSGKSTGKLYEVRVTCKFGLTTQFMNF